MAQGIPMTVSQLLIQGIEHIQERVAAYKRHAREFYFEILLSRHPCPDCGRRMKITGPSVCRCPCGLELDPTVAFQKSACCDAGLAKKRCHYACSICGQTVPSVFLFDERIFDGEYMQMKMRESRERKRRKLAEMKRLLANSRSGAWRMDESPAAAAIFSLSDDLDECIHINKADVDAFAPSEEFNMESYRDTILSRMDGRVVRFKAFPALCDNLRLDRVRRFATLVFMEHTQEVWLEQRGDEISVMPYGADD
jgi:hypothetical protein